MRTLLARFCLWRATRLQTQSDCWRALAADLLDLPPMFDLPHIDTSDRPFGLPPDVPADHDRGMQ